MSDTVLITDGETRAALAVVRSLGRAGYRCCVVSSRGRSLAGASRYAYAKARVPDPLQDARACAAELARLAGRWGARVLLPLTDASVLAVLESDLPSRLVVPFPPLEAFRRISDKELVLSLAPTLGIPVPAQQTVENPGALGGVDPLAIQYPVVLKPGRSVAQAGGERMKVGVRHAASAEEFAARMADFPPTAFPVLVQQRIVGPGVGIFLLLWDSGTVGQWDRPTIPPSHRLTEVVAVFSHRRIREKPPAGGVSVYRESIAADPDLVAKSWALLDHFGWRGVAMIEYKVDAATGTPYLMEVNGRFWGSLQLAVDAGVDFPVMLVQAAMGGGVRDPSASLRDASGLGYRTGIRSRWWWGDVDHLFARMLKSNARLALPPGSPGRLRALADFLLLWRPGDRNEVLRVSDPGPFVRETVDWFRGR